MTEGKVAPLIKAFYPEYYVWNEYPAADCIPFSRVDGRWGILGNFAPVQIVVGGVGFSNAEKLFQMMKFRDRETLGSIYAANGLPLKWAAQGAEKKGLRRPDWGRIIVDAMKFCLQTKYDQSGEFRKTLEETAGYVIVEDQTNFRKKTADTWGAKLENGRYVGSNLLGRLLMELRDVGRLSYSLPADIFDFLKYFSPTSLRLDHEEIYDPSRQNIWCFKHVDDIVEGTLLNLCNMTSCYPFKVNGVDWRSSEELYLCGEFSHDTPEHRAIQDKIRGARSPYAAKRFVKGKHRSEVREDFPEFRTQWMLWVVWRKCLGSGDFRLKLLSLPDDVILVEETTTDRGGSGRIWGCSNRALVQARKQRENEVIEANAGLGNRALRHLLNVERNKIRQVGLFEGQNNIGKILMICRQCLVSGTEPPIDYPLLDSKNIFILGEKVRVR